MPARKTTRRTGSEPSGFFSFPTSFGPMAIAWRGKKIIATHLPEKNEKALFSLMRKKLQEPALIPSDPPAFVKQMAERIRKHLDGRPQAFPLESLALEEQPPFFRKVYEKAHGIPAGKVLTYGELASAAGSPRGSRAVGQAMARNPFPLVIPCHRVLGGSRCLVGFSARGGVATKSRLLQLEGYAHAGREHHQP